MKVYLSTVLLLLFLISCGKKSTDKADLTHPDLPQDPAKSLQLDEEEHNKLKTLKYQLVEGFKNKKPFYVLEREDKIKQFKCSSCHDQPLPERPTGVLRSPLMHTDLKLNHASDAVMDCRSCHNSDDMDTLKLNNKGKVSFNHSYQLCTQCHFQQGKDWAGGAHGKRLHSWRGKRVIMNCTECHDPHDPSFKQHFPVGRPTIPRTGKTAH